MRPSVHKIRQRAHGIPIQIFPPSLDAAVLTRHIAPCAHAISDAIEHHLIEPNVAWLREHEAPLLLQSGVVYGPDPNELWLTIPWILRAIEHTIAFDDRRPGRKCPRCGYDVPGCQHGMIDCEDAVGWFCAEERVRRGWHSIPAVYRSSPLGFHCVAARPLRHEDDFAAQYAIGRTDRHVVIDVCKAIGM